MKTIPAFIALLLTAHTSAQGELGLGSVSINFDASTILHFYSSPNDDAPIRTIQFFYDQSIDSWNIRDLDQQREWLQPEILWLDYSQFVLRCMSVQENWLQVVVNHETHEVLWLEQSNLTTFRDWEKYLQEMLRVERRPGHQQKIRSLPTDNSTEITYQGQDCFQVRSMKEDWIEIFIADYCATSSTEDILHIRSGWIRWRKGNELLIEYFTTC